MVYTVTFNPSLDYIVDVDHFKAGEVNRTNKEMMFPGGKGINVSIVLNNLGYESTALGFLAGFTGAEIGNQLEKEGIKSDFVFINRGMSRINVKLRSDVESEINGTGPKILESDMKQIFQKLDSVGEEDFLVLAGSVPEGMDGSIYAEIMEYVSSKKTKVVVDSTKELLMNVLSFHPFLIKPNNHELGEIYGVELTTREQVVPYAKKLQEAGAQNVLVSMAGKGAVFVASDGSTHMCEAPTGVVKNSVGAGDSMVAGFVAGYLASKSEKEAFQMGVLTGSASAFSDGLATKDEVDQLRKRHVFKQD